MAKPQTQAVLNYILKNGYIDTFLAVRDLGVYRLSARIKELRELGYPIVTIMRSKFIDGTLKNWAEYRMKDNDTESDKAV